MQRIQPEHIQKGIEKYGGVRNAHLEGLMHNGGLPAEVFVFRDGRVMVKYLVINQAILYANEEEFMNKIVLSD